MDIVSKSVVLTNKADDDITFLKSTLDEINKPFSNGLQMNHVTPLLQKTQRTLLKFELLAILLESDILLSDIDSDSDKGGDVVY